VKKMPPSTSRPPLTSRIRASFEGKRAKTEVTTPNGQYPTSFATTDPELLRQAVDAAVNGDAFQAAIASHLARLLKPSIKSALDTIQPVVEAVYQHEILLKKTNASVENLLLRLEPIAEKDEDNRSSAYAQSTLEYTEPPGPKLPRPLSSHPPTSVVEADPPPAPYEVEPEAVVADEAPKPYELIAVGTDIQSAAKLSEISSSVRASNGKLDEVVEGIASMKACSEQSATTTSVMQAQLDQLQLDVGHIITTIGPNLGTNIKEVNDHIAGQDSSVLATHTSKLDAISADIAAMKGGSDVELLQTIFRYLETLKGNIEAGIAANNENFESLSSQVTNVHTTLNTHTSTLGEIKESDKSADILAGVQQSNESHSAHSVALSELKERNVSSRETSAAALGGDPETTAALQSMSASLTALKENVEAGLAANSDGLTGLGTKIEDVLITLEAHKDASPNAEILAEVQKSNESHASHAATLEEIKSLSIAPASEAISTGQAVNLGPLEEQVEAIISTLEAHTATLDEVKSKEVSVPAPVDTKALDAHINAMIATLDAHTVTLDDIKAKDFGGAALAEPNTEALDAHMNTVISTLKAHTTALDEIKAKDFTSAPASEQTSDALDAHNLHMSAVISILEAHSEALDEIKTSVTSSEPVPSNDAFEVLEPHIAEMKAALESHTATLDELKGRNVPSEAIPANTSIEILEPHIAAMKEALDYHTIALDEIKARNTPETDSANSLDILEPHITAIIEALDAHTVSLDELKAKEATPLVAPTSESTELATLELHITAIKDALDAQTASLDELKARETPSAVAPANEGNDLSVLEPHINAIRAALDTHTASLDEIKARNVSVETPPPADNGLEVLEPHITAIRSALESHSAALDEIKAANVSSDPPPETDNTQMEALESHIAAIRTALEAHSSTLYEINATNVARRRESSPPDATSMEPHIAAIISTLNEHTLALEEIKTGNAIAPPETNLLDEHIPTILNTLIAHTHLLTEIKESDVSDEILTALHDQAATISEIREADVSDEILTALHTCNDFHTSHTAALSDIHTAVGTSNESHALHATILGELKSRSIEPSPASDLAAELYNFEGLETKIDAIATTLEGHNTMFSELKDAAISSIDSHADHTAVLSKIKEATLASNEFHTAHTAAFAELKEASTAANDLHASHITAISELKSTPEDISPAPEGDSISLGAIETYINSIISTLDAQSTTLSEIKDAATSHELLSAVKGSHELLTSHTTLLESIKDGISHEDILANIAALKSVIEEARGDISAHGTLVKDLHEETKSSHAGLTAAIGALAVGGAAGAGASLLNKSDSDNPELLEEVKSLVTAVSRSHATVSAISTSLESLTAQIDINHTTTTTSLSTLSDEIKAEIDATGTEISESLRTLSGDVKGIELQSLSDVVGECAKDMRGLSLDFEKLDNRLSAQVGQLLEEVAMTEKRLNSGEVSPALAKEFKSGEGETPPLAREIESEPATREIEPENEPIVEPKSEIAEDGGDVEEPPLADAAIIEEEVSQPEESSAAKEEIVEDSPAVEEPPTTIQDQDPVPTDSTLEEIIPQELEKDNESVGNAETEVQEHTADYPEIPVEGKHLEPEIALEEAVSESVVEPGEKESELQVDPEIPTVEVEDEPEIPLEPEIRPEVHLAEPVDESIPGSANEHFESQGEADISGKEEKENEVSEPIEEQGPEQKLDPEPTLYEGSQSAVLEAEISADNLEEQEITTVAHEEDNPKDSNVTNEEESTELEVSSEPIAKEHILETEPLSEHVPEVKLEISEEAKAIEQDLEHEVEIPQVEPSFQEISAQEIVEEQSAHLDNQQVEGVRDNSEEDITKELELEQQTDELHIEAPEIPVEQDAEAESLGDVENIQEENAAPDAIENEKEPLVKPLEEEETISTEPHVDDEVLPEPQSTDREIASETFEKDDNTSRLISEVDHVGPEIEETVIRPQSIEEKIPDQELLQHAESEATEPIAGPDSITEETTSTHEELTLAAEEPSILEEHLEDSNLSEAVESVLESESVQEGITSPNGDPVVADDETPTSEEHVETLEEPSHLESVEHLSESELAQSKEILLDEDLTQPEKEPSTLEEHIDEPAETEESASTPEIGTEESASASVSTSAIASPLSPTFPREGESQTASTGTKKGKKGKKEKKEKKPKKGKKEEFVFDPELEDDNGEGPAS